MAILTLGFGWAPPGFPLGDFPDVSLTQDELKRTSKVIMEKRKTDRDEPGRRVNWEGVIGFSISSFQVTAPRA